MLAGYSRQLSPEEAAALAQSVVDLYERLREGGDEAAATLELFSLGAISVFTCNSPLVGPALAAYLSYNSGVLSKALEMQQVVFTENTIFSSASSVLQLAALVLATAEGLYLSVITLKKRELWEPLETVSVMLLQASLMALASVLEVSSIFS